MFVKKPKGAVVYEEGSAGVSSIVWMLFGAAITLIIGVYTYIKSERDTADTMPQQALVETIVKQSDADVEVKSTKDSSYEFYDILPDDTIPTSTPTLKQPSAEQVTDEIAKQALAFTPDVVVAEEKNNVSTHEDVQENKALNSTVKVQKVVKTAPLTPLATTTTTTTQTTAKKDLNKNPQPTVNTSVQSPVKPVQSSTSTNKKAVATSDIKTSPKKEQEVIVYTSKKVNQTGVSTVDISQERTNNTDAVLVGSAEDIKNLGSDLRSNTQSGVDDKASVPTTQASTPQVSSSTVITQKNTTSTESRKPPSKAEKSYILQINSYDSADEADTRRAQVIMTGINARVIKNSSGVYQVVSDAMSTPQTVIESQRTLQKSGIDSVVIEQRR